MSEAAGAFVCSKQELGGTWLELHIALGGGRRVVRPYSHRAAHATEQRTTHGHGHAGDEEPLCRAPIATQGVRSDTAEQAAKQQDNCQH